MANTPKSPKDANSDRKNPNRGALGTNAVWDKAQGNRGKRLNPNQGGGKGSWLMFIRYRGCTDAVSVSERTHRFSKRLAGNAILLPIGIHDPHDVSCFDPECVECV